MVRTTPSAAQRHKITELRVKITQLEIKLAAAITKIDDIQNNVAPPLKAMSLKERLEGYVPSPTEIATLRAQLKERLKVLGPRLMEDED